MAIGTGFAFGEESRNEIKVLISTDALRQLVEDNMEIDDIKKILPHRYPFLLVDRVINFTDKKIEAIKNITVNEPFFQGHFPDYPLMPGVLMIEAIAQTAGILIVKLSGQDSWSKDSIPLFLGIDRAKFKRKVRPGDQLKIICEITSLKGKIAKVFGQVLVGTELACEAELLLGFSAEQNK